MDVSQPCWSYLFVYQFGKYPYFGLHAQNMVHARNEAYACCGTRAPPPPFLFHHIRKPVLYENSDFLSLPKPPMMASLNVVMRGPPGPHTFHTPDNGGFR